MLFQDISAQIIKDSQIQAKWKSDQERRYLANFALDMYYGLYSDYLNRKIDTTVDLQGDLLELKKYIDTMDITKDIITDISTVFAEKPEVNVTIEGVIHDDYTEALNSILEAADWFVTFNELNRLTNLFFDMAAVPVTRNGKIEIDLITPDRAFIDNNDFDPITAEVFYYLISELPNSQDKATRTDVYMACSKAGKKLVTVSGYGTKKIVTPYTGSGYGDFIDDTKYPVNPAIMFRNYKAINSFWHPGLNPLIENDLNICMRLTEYNMATAYQIPLLVTVGLPDSQKITKGQKARINIPPNMGVVGSANYLTPDQKLDVLGKQVYDRVERLKLSKKLSKSTISGQTATSGYELMLSKAEILEWNKKQRKYYFLPFQQLCKCIMAMSNKYGKYRFAENCEIDIVFGDQKFMETPGEKIDRQSKEILSGLKNLVDIEIENSDGTLDRKEAMIRIAERKKENKELAILTAPDMERAKPGIAPGTKAEDQEDQEETK